MNLDFVSLTFGADPELFFSKNGKVVGAEKVLPALGIRETEKQYVLDKDGNGRLEDVPIGKPVVIIDGVQAEFNVVPSYCRQVFSHNITTCFLKMQDAIKNAGVKCDFSQTVEIEKKELETLSPGSQQFGCAPSHNAYGRTKVEVKDASKYYSRSAGGHIHMGLYPIPVGKNWLKENADMVVNILDIVVGNTCVLIDRDPGNIERRKNYGRAGEYRLPKHGLEYRTLSNFWLRSYQTTSFVLALVRFGVCIANNLQATKHLMSLVDPEDITKAINNNDAVLAQKNFDKIKVYLSSLTCGSMSGPFPLQGTYVDLFEHFAKKGLDHWFKEDIMQHWLTHNWREKKGWERFLSTVVAPEMPAIAVTNPVEQAVLLQAEF